jgi:excisionase family DNA binding protein
MTAPIPLMTVPEVAAVLRVAPNTVWELFRQGKLRRTKVGRLTRVRQTDLERFLERQGR